MTTSVPQKGWFSAEEEAMAQEEEEENKMFETPEDGRSRSGKRQGPGSRFQWLTKWMAVQNEKLW